MAYQVQPPQHSTPHPQFPELYKLGMNEMYKSKRSACKLFWIRSYWLSTDLHTVHNKNKPCRCVCFILTGCEFFHWYLLDIVHNGKNIFLHLYCIACGEDTSLLVIICILYNQSVKLLLPSNKAREYCSKWKIWFRLSNVVCNHWCDCAFRLECKHA